MSRRKNPSEKKSRTSLRSLNARIHDLAGARERFEELDDATLTQVIGGEDMGCLNLAMCYTDTCTCLIEAD